MQKIIPHLWFDKEAVEAAGLYISIFENSEIKNITTIDGTPSGSADLISFQLAGQDFMGINAGPVFKFTPAVSFMVACASVKEADSIWDRLAPGGSALMDLGAYPFADRYGWTTDKFGLSWQVNYRKDATIRQKITPSLLFTGGVCGKAEEAIHFYTSVFQNSGIGEFSRYGRNQPPDREGTLNYAPFILANHAFIAMDSALDHKFSFNEAISFLVNCDDQAEIDYYWEKLSAVPEAEQCGWLKDEYGMSWQITPAIMAEMMAHGTKTKLAKVTEAFLKMKKFDIATLRKAYDEG